MALHPDKESSSHLHKINVYFLLLSHQRDNYLTQQRDDNSLNSAIGTTHCCLKAYGTKGHLSSKILPSVGLDLNALMIYWSGSSFSYLSTIATTQVVSTVVSTRTLVI